MERHLHPLRNQNRRALQEVQTLNRVAVVVEDAEVEDQCEAVEVEVDEEATEMRLTMLEIVPTEAERQEEITVAEVEFKIFFIFFGALRQTLTK